MNIEAILFLLAGALRLADARAGFVCILLIGVLRFVH